MPPGTGARKYAATDPAASIPKRIVLLLRQKERVEPFSVDMVFPLYFPTIFTLANVRAAEFMQ